MIYGLGILSFSYVAGKIIGEFVGVLTGVNSDIGGVAFAMILVLYFASKMDCLKDDKTKEASAIMFWQNMYIPVSIAMAASQNVVSALSSGWVAIGGGMLATIVGFLFVPIISKMGNTEIK